MEEKEIKIFIKQKAMSLQRNQFEFLFQWSSTNLNLIWCLGLVHSPLSASSYWRTAPRKIYNTSFKSLTFSFHLYFSCCTHLKAVTITLPHVSWMLQSGFHWECLLSWWVGRGGGKQVGLQEQAWKETWAKSETRGLPVDPLLKKMLAHLAFMLIL